MSKGLSHLVSARDRYIHFKILHRVILYSSKNSQYGADDATCWRCTAARVDFDHIFWHCQPIQEFWTGVTKTIQGLMSLPVPVTILVCLLGLVEEVLSLTLFYAHKAILLCWKKCEVPFLAYWKGIVNKVLPFYKATYLSRGCPQKFEKVWQCWLLSVSDDTV